MPDNARSSLAEEVESKGWTHDEMMEHSFITPEEEGTTEVVVPPEWTDDSEEGPDAWQVYEEDGERILHLKHRDCDIFIRNNRFADWKVKIDIPEDVSRWLYGPGGLDHSVRSQFSPGLSDMPEGYIESVEKTEVGARVICRLATNFQPIVESKSLINDFWDYVESAKKNKEDVEEAFRIAKENEEESS